MTRAPAPPRLAPLTRGLSAFAAAALLTLGTVGGLGCQAQPAPAPPGPWAPLSDATTAFVDVAVVDVEGGRVLEHQTVVVSNGRITAVGPVRGTTVPGGATRVDGRGKFLMPGLVDMHAHFVPGEGNPQDAAGRQMALYLANGVTTVRGLIAPPGYLQVRERARRGEIVSPALIVAGPSLNGNSVSGVQAARTMVADQKAAGYEWLKTHGGLSAEVYDTIVAAARREGIPLSGHVTPGYGLERAIAARQQVEHLDGFVAAALPEGVEKPGGQFVTDPTVLARVDDARLAALVAQMRDAGICNGPTLALFRIVAGSASADALAARPEMRFASANALGQWRSQKAQFATQIGGPGAEVYLDLRDRIARALHEGGARLVISSDSPQFFLVPGFAVHREIEAWAAAGIPAAGILRGATVNAAECLGQGGEFGTVAAGKRADLLLLDADPLRNLQTLTAPAGVMVRGRWIPAAELQQMLAAVEAAVRAG